jgi:LPS sulfotransferase NodH
MSETKKETSSWKETTGSTPKGGVYDTLTEGLSQIVSQLEEALRREEAELKRAELEVARVKAQKETRRDG